MNWRFWQRADPAPSVEAQIAQAMATDKLSRAQDSRARVEHIAKGLEELRLTNHLAERVWESFRGVR